VLILLVRLDLLVVHAAFMLRHQVAIFLSLFICLDLLGERTLVVKLRLLSLHLGLLLLLFDGIDSTGNIIRI